jgi:V/A-type H+-transporting ATPase subunit E
MEHKVQEITEKIFREGVEKGQVAAHKIVEEAEAKKAEMLKNAKQEAEKIVADAKKSAEELTKHTHSELKLYAARALEALSSEIVNLMTNAVVNTAVSQTVNNEWLQKLMLTLATDWVTKENVVIQTADANALTQYFAKHAAEMLNKGVTIEQVNGNLTRFTITPAHKGYKVTFGEKEFADFFKEFLRPKLVEMLFNND